jgi:hypothetical protein
MDSPLAVTVLSVGLAGLSCVTKSQQLGIIARLTYGIALPLINHVLHEPDQAIEDETLASVESLLPEAGVIRLSQKKLRYINEMPPEPELAD